MLDPGDSAEAEESLSDEDEEEQEVPERPDLNTAAGIGVDLEKAPFIFDRRVYRDEENTRLLEKYMYFIRQQPTLSTPRELAEHHKGAVYDQYQNPQTRKPKELPGSIRRLPFGGKGSLKDVWLVGARASLLRTTDDKDKPLADYHMKLRAPDPTFGKPRKPKKPVYPPNIGLHVHKFTYDEADRLYYENNKDRRSKDVLSSRVVKRVDDDFDQPERTEANFITKELDNDVLGHFFGSMRRKKVARMRASRKKRKQRRPYVPLDEDNYSKSSKGSSTLNRFGANLFRTMNKLAHSPVVTLVVGSITSFFPSPTAAQTLAIGADNPMLAGKEGQTAGDDVSVATTLSDLSHTTTTTTSISKDSKGHVIPLLMMSRTKKKNPFSSGSSQNSVQTGSSSSTARTASSSSSSAASRQPKTKRRAVTIHVTGTSVVSHDDPSQSKTDPSSGASDKGSTLRGTVDGLFKTLTPLPYLKSLRSTHSAESSAAVDPPVEHLDHIFRRAYAANNLTDPFPDIYYRNPIIHAYNKVRGRRNDTVADDEILLQGVESGSVDMTRRALRQGTDVDMLFDNMTVFYRAFLRALARDAGDEAPALRPLDPKDRIDHEVVLRMLLRHGADVNVETCGDGWSPIHHAAKRNNLKRLAQLLRHGAHKEARTTKQETPFLIAAQHECFETIRYLFAQGANVKARDDAGWTALHHSASLASHTTTDLLLVCGADRLAKDKEGLTPLDRVPEDSPELYYAMQIFQPDNGRDLHLLRYMDGVVYAKGHRRMRFTWPPNDPSSTIRMDDPTVPLGTTMTLDWQALGEKLRSGLASFVQRSAHAKQVALESPMGRSVVSHLRDGYQTAASSTTAGSARFSSVFSAFTEQGQTVCLPFMTGLRSAASQDGARTISRHFTVRPLPPPIKVVDDDQDHAVGQPDDDDISVITLSTPMR